MQPTVDDVRYDLAMTRARMAATLEEIEERVGEGKGVVRERVAQARQALDVRDIAREHPWMALGAAMALGMLVAGSGADRRAAGAATEAARALPGAAMGAGSAIADKVKGLRGSDAGDESPVEPTDETGPGFFDRIASRLGEALQLDRFVAELAEASRSFTPAPEPTPGVAPTHPA